MILKLPQARRRVLPNGFHEQEERRKKGDAEASPGDQDYLENMQYGMPPAAGFGIGIDRLTLLLTDTHNIRDVILFPTLKPEQS